jgi:hypothetical protein
MVAISITGHAIDGWQWMSPAERQVALEDQAAAGYVPAGAYNLDQPDSPTMVQAGGVPNTSGNWWQMSAFADLVGERSPINAADTGIGSGNFGLGFGGAKLPKLPWLLILAGVAVIIIAVRR